MGAPDKYVRRRDTGRRKRAGAAGKEAAHVVSFEVMQKIGARVPGKAPRGATEEAVVRFLNSDENLVVKSAAGNRGAGGKNARDNDRALDAQIIAGEVRTAKAHKRAQRQWARIKRSKTLPLHVKRAARVFYRELASRHGAVVRKNAALE